MLPVSKLKCHGKAYTIYSILSDKASFAYSVGASAIHAASDALKATLPMRHFTFDVNSGSGPASALRTERHFCAMLNRLAVRRPLFLANLRIVGRSILGVWGRLAVGHGKGVGEGLGGLEDSQHLLLSSTDIARGGRDVGQAG